MTNEIKIVCIGDPHFKEFNKNETDEMHRKIIKAIKKIKPDYIVDMGDTLDRFKQVNEFALRRAVDFITDLSKIAKTFVLIGNHDRPTQDDFLSPYHPFVGMENLKNVTIVAETLCIRDEKLNGILVFVPYVPPGKFKKALFYENKISKADYPNIISIFGHQEIVGCEYNERISKNGDHWNSKNPLLVLGHIHNYQRLKKNVLYVGTPIQHDFGDLTKKSISLLTFSGKSEIDDNQVNLFQLPMEERIYLNIKERQVIKLTAAEALNWEFDANFIWKIIIFDTRDNIELFYMDKHYRNLIDQGVVFEEQVIQKMRKIYKKDIPTINAANFKKQLWKRIEHDKRQVDWLQYSMGK